MSLALLPPYVDGYFDTIGKELTVVPRIRHPFKDGIPSDTYTRQYERDFEVFPGAPSRLDARTAWTNLITYSEDIDNAAWTKTNLTVSANNTTAPDGLVTMDKLLESSATGEHSISQAVTVTAAAHELSFFIKGGLTRSWVRAAFTDSGSTVRSAFFSTSGYAVSATSGTTAKIVGLGNGHFHCVLRFTPAAGAGTLKINTSTDGSTISFAGSTAAGVYLWGAQVALGSIAPYVSTTSAARSILAPDRDPRDPLAFLMLESDQEPVNSATARVTRTFGRIPKTQTIHGSRPIPKPKISGTFPRVINGVLVSKPDEDVDEYTFTTQVAVTNDTGAPSFGITGGASSLTFGADTAAGIAYNAVAATYQSALNALASISVRNGVVVTGGPTLFNIEFNPWPVATADASGLTVSVGTPTLAITYETPTGAPSPFRRHVRFRSNHGYTTAGDYTVTLLGEETAPIAFDATRQEVEDAINALTVIGSGAVVTVSTAPLDYSGKPLSTTGASLDFYVTLPMPTTSTSDTFTPSGSANLAVASGTIDGAAGLGWTLTLIGSSSGTRTITAPAHGVTAAEDLSVTAGGIALTLPAGTFTVPTASTIQLTSASGGVFYGPAITAVGVDTGKRYAADSPDIHIEMVQTFYLPGVSVGINEANDIPIPSRVTPAQLLGAIFSGATLANYDVGQIEQWEGTPCFSIVLTTLNPQLLISPDV